MRIEPFFLVFDIYLLVRLFIWKGDTSLSPRRTALSTVFMLATLFLFEYNANLILLGCIFIAFGIAQYYLESRWNIDRMNIIRFSSLMIFIMLTGFLLYDPQTASLKSNVYRFINWILDHNILCGNSAHWKNGQYILAGLLLNLREANIIIRFVISRENGNSGISNHDLKAGRIIGILERLLFCFFLLRGEFSAIGFVLAAKGVIRFKEKELQAEYFLIGTMLSLICSIVIFVILNRYLQP